MSTPESLPPSKPADTPDAVAVWVNGHPDDGMLHAGLDDQLSSAESALVAEHVSRCADCRSRVAEAHGMIASARRIVTRAKESNESSAPAPIAASEARAPRAPSAAPAAATASSPTRPAAPANQADIGSPKGVAPAVAATVPVAAPIAPAAAASAPAPTPTAPRAVAAPARSAPAKKRTAFPWARVGSVAAFVAVVGSGVLVWRTLGRDFGAATPAPAQPAARPSAQPDTLGVADAAITAPVPEPTVPQGSADGKLDVTAGPAIAAFDSLVLTRKTCASSCDEFILNVMSNGSVRYNVHLRNGQDRFADATTADAALRKMSALITSVLFETSAVPSSGRSVCTVFDASHVPAVQLMVAHGSSSALHANSCSASPKVLLTLAAQIDSLVGSERLQQSAQREGPK